MTAERSLTKPVLWGVAIGVAQTFSPLAFWWLTPVVVWSLSVAIIGAIYIGFAVADGRPHVIATETVVATAFVVLAAAAMKPAPWLVVIALVAHGIKDTLQHRTQFVANMRWWPPFCLVVDFVAAALIAVRLLMYR